ncbi:hypothetical protein EJ06DRAFT_516848 [Trichodelitschia bisporula]|uniref:Zinc transporter n=1 Tax=Trichodelitschia bisporula TaxID=703511 RepID=A0A6G1HJS2_9PEZI|nr:hypothetical protein EJ06DRAFT_516848 [Trichodelitschia bisporula]
MATSIPAPPRTPTPPPDDPPPPPQFPSGFNPDALSPLSSTFPTSYRNIAGSPANYGVSPSLSDASALSPPSTAEAGPFNFKPTPYIVGRPAGAAAQKQTELGRRRGHKYARSSISHQIILSPTPRTPLALPISLPVPTLREYISSMSPEQKRRWAWCTTHLLVAGWVQTRAHGSLATTSLSHLLFFDALGAFLCVAVDVGANFEVWTRSSIAHPFGLQRSEVLAGLAMSIILLFMGLDLLSHGLAHAAEHRRAGRGPHSHAPRALPPGTVDAAALASIVCSLVSAASLGNHARIGRAMRFELFPAVGWLPRVLRNPSHLLTLSCAGLLLLVPLLGVPMYAWVDAALGFGCAVAMVGLGARLAYTLGRMLLMSYSGKGVRELVGEVEGLDGVVAVDEAGVWQVHYGLCMASFRVRVRGKGEVEGLRERIGALVRSRLGGQVYGEGKSGVRWEVSVMVNVEE